MNEPKRGRQSHHCTNNKQLRRRHQTHCDAHHPHLCNQHSSIDGAAAATSVHTALDTRWRGQRGNMKSGKRDADPHRPTRTATDSHTDTDTCSMPGKIAVLRTWVSARRFHGLKTLHTCAIVQIRKDPHTRPGDKGELLGIIAEGVSDGTLLQKVTGEVKSCRLCDGVHDGRLFGLIPSLMHNGWSGEFVCLCSLDNTYWLCCFGVRRLRLTGLQIQPLLL